MIELKLAGDLEDVQFRQFAAAGIGGAPVGNKNALDARSIEDIVLLGRSCGVPLLALDNNNKVVGFYILSPFTLIGDRLANTYPGYLVVNPRGIRIGSLIIASLVPLFESLGHEIHTEIVHTVGAERPTTLYLRQGYNEIRGAEGLEWDGLKLYRKTYFPRE